jgi:hypothetical protein
LYVFRPHHPNEFIAATDGGIYLVTYNGSAYQFQAKNKNFNVTQFYSLDITGEIGEVLGGSQNNGTIYISGQGNAPKKGEDLWRPANLDPKFPEGTDGGAVAISGIRSIMPGISEKFPASFYSKSPIPKEEALNARVRRSENFGEDFSNNFFSDESPVNPIANFYTPIALWESYDNSFSRDSVTFIADKNYSEGDLVVIRSKNFDQPFSYFLPDTLPEGDSIRVQDIISTKLFIATQNNIWMTLEGIRFDTHPDWLLISNNNENGFAGNPSCIAYSSDANYIFVGTYTGKLYRISNIALAYNAYLADVRNPGCIIATTELEVYEGNTQVITSIAVDPKDANKVLVTLGKYDNTDYVYYSTNSLSDVPVFTSVQGNLPPMPVFSSVLEMQSNSDIAIIGTEKGIWKSEDVSGGVWSSEHNGMGIVPVMALKQQIKEKPSFTVILIDPGTNDTIKEEYTAINNYGMIYAATYGRGIFRLEKYYTLGEEEVAADKKSFPMNLSIFPNPASNNIKIDFNLDSKSDVQCRIFDLEGRIMISKVFNTINKGHQQFEVEVNSLSRGTYLLLLTAGDQKGSAKLVIMK